MNPWTALKMDILATTGLERDALHIYVALLAMFAACLIFRWKISQLRTLFVVFLVAMTGEYLDISKSGATNPFPLPESSKHDLWNTMLAPVMLYLGARFTTIFERPRSKAESNHSNKAGDSE